MTCDQIEVTYKVVTPLFCGGADGSTAEVRVPSIKGVLRWWWRALAWSRCQDDLAAIHKEEAALFGSAKGGQSRVLMRLVSPAAPKGFPCGEILKLDGKTVGEGARYLGYGVMEAFGSRKNGTEPGQLLRSCLEAPIEIGLELRARDLQPDQRNLLLDALRAMGLLGGLGAKSRKGYGSTVLQAMRVNGESRWSPPRSPRDLDAEIATLIPAASTSEPLPAYTALSRRMRIVLWTGHDGQKPLALLDAIGRELVRYRSWGHNGKVLGLDREGNFQPDHDLMKQRPEQRRTHPVRIAFGLPHNYGKEPEDKIGPSDPEDGDRRASPLLLHIHACGTTPVAVLSFLPAVFLSRGDGATINVGGARVPIARDPELWQPIHGFLDRFLRPDRRDLADRAREVRR